MWGMKNDDIEFVDMVNADIFELNGTGTVNEDLIRVKSKSNHVWDIKSGSNKVIYRYNVYQKPSQHFLVQKRSDEHFKIVISDQECIAYNAPVNYFVKERCRERDMTQLFDVVALFETTKTPSIAAINGYKGLSFSTKAIGRLE
ncbi:hypothetical protein THOM_2552 [Trachipleistophora hominis]|uniref:Uncharacterized protein n=1 Tax=Trachipleistophora hominis TaxID=72359 RepID=L7JUT0_TRAHO|nr:hypothetical protein THOM_2552 [Trachipleistophora hominis]